MPTGSVESPTRGDFRLVFAGVQASLRNNEGKTVSRWQREANKMGGVGI